ncbi:hypothetical protein SLEP1_g30442 [Rubroshorea leprosula]|uniref:Uncharacterized protein n=1 Tax=Rubroshorea leprosula TaxID=152421 RepID=A0AAV5K5X0_9ROSI|nr:hypothetical protein SLEP1_g30442 [Rubroshorea leprosula]
MSNFRRDQMVSKGLGFEALSFIATASGPDFLLPFLPFFLVLATVLDCLAMMLPVYGEMSCRRFRRLVWLPAVGS